MLDLPVAPPDGPREAVDPERNEVDRLTAALEGARLPSVPFDPVPDHALDVEHAPLDDPDAIEGGGGDPVPLR